MAKKKMNKSRREFIKDTAQSALMLTLLDSVVESIIKTNFRQALGATPGSFKNFIHLNMYSSAPRWGFDLVLNPTNDPTKFISTPMISNQYVLDAAQTRYVGAKYVVAKDSSAQNYTQGLYVPSLLSRSIPTAAGGTAPAWKMLQNMIQIRGINVLNAGHPGANMLHQAAVPGEYTLSSVTADNSQLVPNDPVKNMIRATSLNGSSIAQFKSTKGYANFGYDVRAAANGNDLLSMFQSVQPMSKLAGVDSAFLKDMGDLEYQIEDAMKALNSQQQGYQSALSDSADAANRILADQAITTFADLATDWTSLYTNKYKMLVDKVLASQIPGVKDTHPVGIANPASVTAAQKAAYQFGRGGGGSYTFNLDATGKTDLRLMMASANLNLVAAQFAVIEFLIMRGICPSVSVILGAMAGVSEQDIGDANPTVLSMVLDQHFQGYMPGIMQNSYYFLGISACINALIDALKSKPNGAGGSVFDDTLIYMASEFNRMPKADGSGSDHAPRAAHINLFSGKIPKFQLIGNIYKDGATAGGAGSNYPGTWGQGAPLQLTATKSQELDILQVWGSVMKLLGAPKISNRVDLQELIFEQAGVPTISAMYNKAARNV